MFDASKFTKVAVLDFENGAPGWANATGGDWALEDGVGRDGGRAEALSEQMAHRAQEQHRAVEREEDRRCREQELLHGRRVAERHVVQAAP